MTHCQRVLELLSDGQPHTHHELYRLNVIAHSRVAELRKRGHKIACWTAKDNGETVSVYQLLPSFSERDTPSPSTPDARGSETSRSEKEVEQLSLDVPYRVPEWA
jgi:hypothetical protein